MKPNRKTPVDRKGALAVAGIAAAATILVALMFCYEKLHELWLEQCIVHDMNEQVTVTSGKMVKGDVITGEFGITNGANLALIDFRRKREEILRKIPNLRSISVSRSLPDKVAIVSEERTPIAQLNYRGRRATTGKVVDSEGVVFVCQRGTQMLPVIREMQAPGSSPGTRLSGRALAALRMIEVCREADFTELGVQEIDISKRDYLLATLGNYSRAKIAWEGFDGENSGRKKDIERQLSMLLQAIRSRVATGTVIWNATDTSSPGRVYADTKGAL
ncbi:MAG: hypothetical protein IKL85_10160 [Lentisphaeria bacterium]|nr:hypothetical protein [Lentisphaeria bacterium]